MQLTLTLKDINIKKFPKQIILLIRDMKLNVTYHPISPLQRTSKKKNKKKKNTKINKRASHQSFRPLYIKKSAAVRETRKTFYLL